MTPSLPPRSPEELTRWAREHLVYEAAMLLHTLKGTAAASSDQDRNAFIESFAVHVRCLRDFLWSGSRGKDQDALAIDFCGPGVWQRERGKLPAALATIEGDRKRIGREIVHLTYHRLDIAAESKEWRMGEIAGAIASKLARFGEVAQPDRIDRVTRATLRALQGEVDPLRSPLIPLSPDVTGATRMIAPNQVTGGTIPFEGFTARDAEPS